MENLDTQCSIIPIAAFLRSQSVSDLDGAALGGDAAKPAEDSVQFTLFCAEWLNLQNQAAAMMKLPISTADWNKSYGAVEEKYRAQADKLLASIRNVQNLGLEFGNPVSFKNKILENPDYFNLEEAPVELYPHIVWLSFNISQTASEFESTIEFMFKKISDCTSAKERVAIIKELMCGEEGLQTVAGEMAAKTRALMGKILDFDKKITNESRIIMDYNEEKDSLFKWAEVKLQSLRDELAALNAESKKALDTWRGYTISASTSSVAIAILSFGLFLPVSIALGGGLGGAAAAWRTKYDSLQKKIREMGGDGSDLQKKTVLVEDLKALSEKSKTMSNDLNTFLNHLEKIEGAWLSIQTKLSALADDKKLSEVASNISKLKAQLKVQLAVDQWQVIRQKSDQFCENSLVTYDSRHTFGDPLQ